MEYGSKGGQSLFLLRNSCVVAGRDKATGKHGRKRTQFNDAASGIKQKGLNQLSGMEEENGNIPGS